MFKADQQVKLKIGNLTFDRVVQDVVNGVVYLSNGGRDHFDNKTGETLRRLKTSSISAK